MACLCDFHFMIVVFCLVMMIALSVYYMYTSAKYAIVFAHLRLRRIYIEVYFFMLKKWRHFYSRHIELWLVVYGLKRSKSWAEIEQYRLEVSANCGYEIPRTLDLEEGLRQEGCL